MGEWKAESGLDIGSPPALFTTWTLGDGYAFALIAADPSGAKLAEKVPDPAYRFSRAGFGWAAWLLALGRTTLVPYGLALAGLFGLLGVIVLAIRLRPDLGPRAWALLLNPALYIGFAGDTAEPASLALLTWAIGSGSVAAGFLLGTFRPSYLAALWGRWRPMLFGAAALFGLALYSLGAFGIGGFTVSGGRITWPLAGFFQHPSWSGLALLGLAGYVLFVGVGDRDWSWILSALLVMSLGEDVLERPQNHWRAAGLLPVLVAFGPLYRPRPMFQVRRDSLKLSPD